MISMSVVMYGCRSCNLNCAYCNSEGDSENKSSKSKVNSKFILDKDKLYTTILNYPPYAYERSKNENAPIIFNIWGGNPLLHFKEFKETAEFLMEKFPNCSIATTDNCLSFKDDEIVDYLISHNIQVQISHDGLGQWIRSEGFDPFEDEKINSNIIKLVKLDLISAINCLLSKANCSLIKNINYFNSWRWKNEIESKNLYIKLNRVIDGDYEVQRENKTGMWNGEIDNSRIGKPIGNLSFSGDEMNTYFSELRMLGILVRKLKEENKSPIYLRPYISWIMEMTSDYKKLSFKDLEFASGCQSFQRGYSDSTFAIDTKGNYVECDLIDSDFKALNSKGKMPKYCQNCKYNILKVCQSCGSVPFRKECQYKKENARLQEEFYLLDTGHFLFENTLDIRNLVAIQN